MSVVRWEDPPMTEARPERRPPVMTKWQSISAQLRSQPGRWAIVATFNPGLSTTLHRNAARATATTRNILCGLYAGMTYGEFEAEWHHVGDEVMHVYARYIVGAS